MKPLDAEMKLVATLADGRTFSALLGVHRAGRWQAVGPLDAHVEQIFDAVNESGQKAHFALSTVVVVPLTAAGRCMVAT